MNKSERQLFLFRGLPGSGKSTAAATQENWDHRVLETDMFLKNKDGDFEFDAARLPWAHDQCFKMALEFLDMGFDVSVANTFTRLWEMEPYLAIPDVKIFIIEMKTQFKSIHDVPDESFRRMQARWEELPADFPWPVVRITEPLEIPGK